MSVLPQNVERVAREIREDILRQRYRPGDRLPSERELAERLQVNRGAVREAFRALAQLGLIVISPGGARAAAVEDASLDVLGHLIALDELPELTLAQEVLEANGILVYGWFRLLVEKGRDDEIDAVREKLRAMSDPAISDAEYARRWEHFVNGIADRSSNLVLRLMRRGMRLHFWERLSAAGVDSMLQRDLFAPIGAKMDAALERRDAAGAAEIAYSLMRLHRERALKILVEEHARAGQGGRHRHSPPPADPRVPNQRPLENATHEPIDER
jgi:DNA-binding FadR family transcriptional regulator